jgi:hypothetical protein
MDEIDPVALRQGVDQTPSASKVLKRVQFNGSVDADQAADEFILAFLARHKGNPVTVEQVWKSLRSRGLTPANGRTPAAEETEAESACSEIDRRLVKWMDEGMVGGDHDPEPITGTRHFWILGNPPSKH